MLAAESIRREAGRPPACALTGRPLVYAPAQEALRDRNEAAAERGGRGQHGPTCSRSEQLPCVVLGAQCPWEWEDSPTGEICWKTLFTGSPSFRRDQHSTMLLVWLDAHRST